MSTKRLIGTSPKVRIRPTIELPEEVHLVMAAWGDSN